MFWFYLIFVILWFLSFESSHIQTFHIGLNRDYQRNKGLTVLFASLSRAKPRLSKRTALYSPPPTYSSEEMTYSKPTTNVLVDRKDFYKPGAVRIGVDYGPRLIGLAISDYFGKAKPLYTIKNTCNLTEVASRIYEVARLNSAKEIVVGLPCGKIDNVKEDLTDLSDTKETILETLSLSSSSEMVIRGIKKQGNPEILSKSSLTSLTSSFDRPATVNSMIALNFSKVLAAIADYQTNHQMQVLLFDESYTTKEAYARIAAGELKGKHQNRFRVS
jgi:RNase H-fold protein (predicted Holliday junction resolvase)